LFKIESARKKETRREMAPRPSPAARATPEPHTVLSQQQGQIASLSLLASKSDAKEREYRKNYRRCVSVEEYQQMLKFLLSEIEYIKCTFYLLLSLYII